MNLAKVSIVLSIALAVSDECPSVTVPWELEALTILYCPETEMNVAGSVAFNKHWCRPLYNLSHAYPQCNMSVPGILIQGSSIPHECDSGGPTFPDVLGFTPVKNLFDRIRAKYPSACTGNPYLEDCSSESFFDDYMVPVAGSISNSSNKATFCKSLEGMRQYKNCNRTAGFVSDNNEVPVGHPGDLCWMWSRDTFKNTQWSNASGGYVYCDILITEQHDKAKEAGIC
mmetsp:Transcript_5785/g.8995  ORF Transcript_5785/g.8995 Transcript_5785/m.8995 type:complete len:228 (+) Transcript_5785:137-820(+)